MWLPGPGDHQGGVCLVDCTSSNFNDLLATEGRKHSPARRAPLESKGSHGSLGLLELLLLRGHNRVLLAPDDILHHLRLHREAGLAVEELQQGLLLSELELLASLQQLLDADLVHHMPLEDGLLGGLLALHFVQGLEVVEVVLELPEGCPAEGRVPLQQPQGSGTPPSGQMQSAPQPASSQ
eukprot:15477205-Alexandrium_andersonii.AAC.1